MGSGDRERCTFDVETKSGNEVVFVDGVAHDGGSAVSRSRVLDELEQCVQIHAPREVGTGFLRQGAEMATTFESLGFVGIMVEHLSQHRAQQGIRACEQFGFDVTDRIDGVAVEFRQGVGLGDEPVLRKPSEDAGDVLGDELLQDAEELVAVGCHPARRDKRRNLFVWEEELVGELRFPGGVQLGEPGCYESFVVDGIGR